jgi:uncharacterized protein YcbK (DUF882 family)
MISATHITKHFPLVEMIRTNHRNIDNRPGHDELANLERTCLLLERIRALLGVPVSVSSGYRCLTLNRAIGSKDSSAHVKGLAADFVGVGMTAKEAALKIAPLVKEFGIDQLCYEQSWIHVGLCEANKVPRNQILTIKFDSAGKPITSMGII